MISNGGKAQHDPNILSWSLAVCLQMAEYGRKIENFTAHRLEISNSVPHAQQVLVEASNRGPRTERLLHHLNRNSRGWALADCPAANRGLIM